MKLSVSPVAGSNEVEVSVVFRLSRVGAAGCGFLQAEELLATKLNEIGEGTTKELLAQCDTQGEPMFSENRKWTTKGSSPRVVETPYGPIKVLCHVYQTSAGGVTRVPLEEQAKLISSATPRFAKMISSKLASLPCGVVARDMEENHLRHMSKSFVQDLGCTVSALATMRTEDEDWQPLSPVEEVTTIAMGVDGAHLLTNQDGWRQSMAGTIALYDRNGERLETLYAGGGPGRVPSEGKATFFTRMDELLERVGNRYPTAQLVGLSDGAADLQKYLAERCDDPLLDFHHAAEYLTKASAAFAPERSADAPAAQQWAAIQRQVMRDEPGGAKLVLKRIRRRLKTPAQTGATQRATQAKQASSAATLLKPLTQAQRESLEGVETYIANHVHCMNYADWQQRKLPIGSGVTEAACKTLIKQRMGQSGMRWSIAASDAIISLRALYLTPSRWDAFWKNHSAGTL
jgi:hypothetical protein